MTLGCTVANLAKHHKHAFHAIEGIDWPFMVLFFILAGADWRYRRWIGPALLPQAGLAIGMALVAAQTYPEIGKVILPIILGSTVVFEILGPILTRRALIKVGET